MQDIAERRRAKRFSARLKIYDCETGDLIGYCEDLSISGLRLMSETPLPANKEIRAWLDRNENNSGTGISLTLFRVWQAFSETARRYYYTGMHIINPDEQTLDQLQDLIDNLF